MGASLSVAVREVMDGIEAVLKEEMIEGGLLADVEDVVYSQRSSKSLRKPLLWIYPARMEKYGSTSKREEWTLPFLIVSVVSDGDEREGMIKATSLVADVRSILLKSKFLGKREFVTRVESVRLVPGNTDTVRGNDYSALVQVDVKLQVFE